MDQITDLFSSDEKVPGEYVAALERASQCLVEAYQNAPGSTFHNLLDYLILLSKPPIGAAGAESAWLFKKSAADGEVGQTLIYQKQAEPPQELLLSLDAKGNLYLGSWRSLKPGEQKLGFMFHLEPSEAGNHLVIDDGQNKKNHLLDRLGQSGWFYAGAEGPGAQPGYCTRTRASGCKTSPIPCPPGVQGMRSLWRAA